MTTAVLHGTKRFDSLRTLGQTGSAMTSATRESSFGAAVLEAPPSGSFTFVVVMSILPF